MANKIAFLSFKGGTGVTTCCVNIGLALAKAGERTLVVDGDVKFGGALTASGLSNMQVYTLADYEKGACRAKQTLVAHPECRNLMIMPSIGLKDKTAAEKAIADVEGLFDYILTDKAALPACDCALIVCEPYPASIKSADGCRSYIFDSGIKDAGLIVNRLNGGLVMSGDIMTAQEIATLLHLPLKAVIPEDLTINLGGMRPQTEKAFSLAADAISGKREGVCNVLRRYLGVGGYIKRKMRAHI